MRQSHKYLLCIILTLVALPVASSADELESAYAAILRGDYDSGRASVSALIERGSDPKAKQLQSWLDEFSGVSSARADVKQQTFAWNVEQAKKAHANNDVYLALTFTARATAYAPEEDTLEHADWANAIVDRALERAAELASNQKWSKATAYYTLAARVRPDDEELEKLGENAARHARIEVLYEDEEEFHRRMRGVEHRLLRDAANTIDKFYYEKPDFKRAADGALDNLEIVCETSTLYDYLHGVANPANREFFRARLEELRDKLDQAQQFGYKDFLKLYKEVAFASEKSVELPEGLLIAEFLEGALAKLDDFTSIVWPVDATEFDKMMMGGYSGVGIQLGIDEYTKRLKVITPLEDSPAIEAGIQAGDLIIEVDHKSTKGWTTEDAVRNIMGKAGTEVTLTMFRPSPGETIDYPLKRRDIVLKTIRGIDRLDDGRGEEWNYILDKDAGIAYVRLTGFQGESARELRRALEQARDQGMRGLILDLRGNPGGLLDVAIDIVSLFVEKGAEVVSTSGISERRERYETGGRAPFADLPLIVLINQASASASEILAGALQDHRRALVLGERSFGKGSVQRVMPLGPRTQARLKLTTALYYLPDGRSPHKLPESDKWGIEPDWPIDLSPKEYGKVIDRENAAYIIKANGADDSSESSPESTNDALDALTDDSADDDDDQLLTPQEIKLLESDPVKVADQDPQLETALLQMRVKLAANLPWPLDLVAQKTDEP